MPLITTATNTGLSIRQLAISSAPVTAAAGAAATPPAKKYAVEEQHLSDILANAAGLRANVNNISSINVKDVGVLEISAADYKANASLISKLSGNRQFKITGPAVTMADMSALVKNKNVVSIAAVSDTAANIAAGMGTLISNNGKFNAGSITKSDAAEITISNANYKQASAAGGLFSKFVTPLASKLIVTGVSASDVTAITSDGKVKEVAVSDSLENIVKNVSAIGAANTGNQLTSITTTAAKTAIVKTRSDYAALSTALGTGAGSVSELIGTTALKNAFAVTGATKSESDTLGSDDKVRSIAVSDTGTNFGGFTLSTKVNKVEVTSITKAQLSTNLSAIASLGNKLSSIKLAANEGDKLSSVDVANVRDKAKALVYAKTQGEHGDPVNLEVINAKLSDVNGLIANKQVSKADIADTAKNMLAFSADKFTVLANASTVKFAIEDSAANISKYHTQLASAVKQFNTDRVSLSVKDTAANLSANLAALDEVATAITGADANGQSLYDETTRVGGSRIKIQQSVSTGGAVDGANTNLIKVAYSDYSARRDVLQYIKDSTAGMNQKHVEIDTSGATSAASVQAALNISTTMQWQDYVTAVTGGTTGLTAPAATVTLAGGALTGVNNATDTYTPGGATNKVYSDIKTIGITLKGTNATADYATIAADDDLSPAAATPTLRTGISIGVNVLA